MNANILMTRVVENGRSMTFIGVLNLSNLPTLLLASEFRLPLTSMINRIAALNDGDVLAIGRSEECEVTLPCDRIYSHYHCFIIKNNGAFKLYDSSLNGTKIVVNNKAAEVSAM